MPRVPAPSGAATPSVRSLCETGLSLHHAGRLEEARAAYETATRRDPRDFQARYLLGLALIQTRRADEGVRQVEQAIGLDRRSPQAWFVLGIGQIALSRFEAAVESFTAGLALNPNVAKAHNDLGTALRGLGRLADAARSYDRAIALDPRLWQAHHERALTMQGLGRPDAALFSFDSALALRPDDTDTQFSRAVLLASLGRPEEAVAGLDRVVALRPDWAEAHDLRGAGLTDLGRLEDALASRERVVALRPHDATARMELSLSQGRLRRFEAALAAAEEGIDLQPNHAGLHRVRGEALQRLRRLPEAMASYDRALGLNPADAQAHYARASALHALGHYEAALAGFDRAIDLEPGHVTARFDRAATLLLLGRFDAAWPDQELRPSKTPAESFLPARMWLGGEDPRGQRLLLTGEQGFGDVIQFARYATPLIERGAAVVMMVQPALRSLVARSWPAARLIDPGPTPDDVDLACPMPSLPLAFGTTLDTIPAPRRYLVADAGLTEHFTRLLGADEAAGLVVPRRRPRVGGAWSGNPEHLNDHNRSIPLEIFGSLITGDVDWVALQTPIPSRDEAALRRTPALRRLDGLLTTFDDTAALVEATDLVITVDTSLAHLAGALGKPVWILLPFVPDWRWLLGRDDSPWYPSARLFRQTAIGDWPGVIERARRALAERWPA